MYQLTKNFRLRYLRREHLWITISSTDGVHITALQFHETNPGNGNNPAPICEKAIKQIGEYFAGTRKNFDLPLAPQTRGREELLKVPYGTVENFMQLALRVNPQARAAAGTIPIVCKNVIPLIIPCHRIVNTDNHIGSYVGFEEYGVRQDPRNLLLKLALIHHEQRNLAIMHARKINMHAGAINRHASKMKKALD